MVRMLLLFNHDLTDMQKSDAEASFGVGEFIPLPDDLRDKWRSVDPDLESIDELAAPFRDWIDENARIGDYVLVQGDYGLTCSMVRYVQSRGCVAVYSTTQRRHTERQVEDGSLEITKRIRHRRFRRYGP